MKKLFLNLSMLLFVLGLSVNAAWADETNIYLASLKAQTDPASTGSGQVKLTWLDITGKPMGVDLAKQMNYMAFGDMSFFAKDYVYDGFGETAQLEGGTLIAIEGTEVAQEIGSGSQIYMTSLIYFHAEAEPDNGSYLADWTFTDPQITRIDTAMGHVAYKEEDYWENGEYLPQIVVDEENSIPLRTPCFKVLPVQTNSTAFMNKPEMEEPQRENFDTDEEYTAAMGEYVAVMTEYQSKMQALIELAQDVAQNKYNTLYAVFNKYLLGNPVATSANVEAEENATANLTVTVEINGDAASLDAEDFATFTFTNNGSSEWEYDLDAALAAKEVVSDQKTRITIPVTYTYQNTGYGLKNTTMTISMAGEGASTLNVNLSANALDPNRPEALWFDGETEMTSGNLSAMLSVDISSYAKPILKLNKQHTDAIALPSKDFTFDLNGNEAGDITIAGGNVTIAYSQYGGSATSLTVSSGKAILNGGTFGSLTINANGTVEQNGATITGAATNAGSLTTTEGKILGGLTSSKTLVMNGGTFKGETAVTVSDGTAAINRATIEGTAIGLKVTGGAATTKKLAAIKGATYSAQRTAGTLTVESGKFDGPLNGTVAFTAGFFKTNTYGISTTGLTEMNVSAGVEYNEGYRYFLGTSESALANGVGVCRIGNVSYSKLEDAIAYANNNPRVENIVIFMTNNYTLPAGYYTLPANATIVVPMSDSQAKEVNATAPRIIFNDVITETPYTSIQPTEFRRLTFASGVNMNMFGDIELTCSQYASNEAYTAQPVGPYGHLVLEENSSITLQDGAEFRAWGFVTGKGEMDARRGAKVREMFQLGDWKGAMTSVQIVGLVKQSENPTLYGVVGGDHSDKKIFPVTQYFIQNIESPVKYHPGAVLSTSATVSEGLMGMSISMGASDIAIVGVSGDDEAIFLMDKMADADNTWVRKWYDSENDIQVYDINSAAHIGSMVLDMGDVNLLQFGTVPIRLNSAKFDLPLTCNFKIHLLSGTMDFLQNTSLLPGAEVEVDKEATVTVAQDPDDTEHTGALYVYDADEWSRYAFKNEYGEEYNEENPQATYTKTVRYSPSWNGRPTKRTENTCPPDAAINVHGTFKTATGFVYCSEHGANIFSNNEDAGTFVFNESAAEAGTRDVYQVMVEGTNSLGKNTKFEKRTFYPAKLKNGNGEYADTQEAEEGAAYCYQNNEWSTMTAEGCFIVKLNEETGDIYYAKPQEFVAVVAHKDEMDNIVGNADHTYSDAAGAGRLFILMEDYCQWWEVEKKDNLYHCIHPNNDTYYYWDEDEDMWMEQKYTITWKNWNDSIIKTYSSATESYVDNYKVTYGTMAEFLGTNPTRPENIDYTYDFTGWTPALGRVTSDVTYTATFTEKPRKYTIIFQQDGGLEIERQFLTHNEVPVCENMPTNPGHTLVWSPAIAAVTGDATYTATWVENPPTEYEITFYDYDGTTVLKQGNVNVGDMPVPPAQVNGKPATSEYTYVFDHWSPAVEKVSATSIKSYTAVYRQVAKTFPVNFYFGSISAENKIGATQFLEIGQDPVIPNDERLQKTEDNANVYQLVWTPQIQTVIGHAEDYTYEYVASYTSTPKQYSLTLKCTPSGAAVITGARADYAYGATPTVTVKANTGYNFDSWSDGEPIGGPDKDGVYSREVTINGNVELTVVCKCLACEKSEIVWMNEAGTAELAKDSIPVGSATIYHGTTPTKENSLDGQYSYTFYGWTTRDNEGHDIDTFKNSMTPKVAAVENPSDQTYTYYACFTEVTRQYNVTLSSNIPNVCMLVGAGTYNYSASAANATVIVSGYDAVNYTFDGWYNGEERVSTAESYSFAVQGDVNLVATFSPVTYTITWKSEDGADTLETDADQAYGAATVFNEAEPTKTNYSFIGWTTKANGDGSFYAKGATPAVSGNATYYAYFAENSTSNNLIAEANGEPVTLGTPTDYTTFTITSNGMTSGQLMDAENLSLLGDAIFNLQPASGIPGRTWYAVAAPWQVDVRTGIYAGGNHLNVGVDFDIIEFDAESYATKEAGAGNANIWKYVEENGGVMQPGKLYLIYLASAKSSLEFHKTNGGILTTTLSVTITSGSGAKANWNAIANPALYHANIDAGVEDYSEFINGGYTPGTYLSSTELIVGQPIFVQVITPNPSVTADVASSSAPYRRAQQAQTADSRFVIEITRNGLMNDRLIVQTADEKENTYVIGQDMAKMGVGTKTAQMWMERYSTKLCKNTVEMEDERAEYPLNIYAPAAGEYTLSAMQQRGDADLYLTMNGEAIWNLSNADYTLNLQKGTAANYGLRISVKKTPTGVDEAIVDSKDAVATKVLIGNQVFIIRGENVYSIDGQLVK